MSSRLSGATRSACSLRALVAVACMTSPGAALEESPPASPQELRYRSAATELAFSFVNHAMPGCGPGGARR